MKKNIENSANYIEELEQKVVDLSLQLKNNKNELSVVKAENFQRLRKAIHNLKNPVGVGFSFAEILATVDCVSSNEKYKKYIEIIKNSNDYSIQILNSLAKLNRLISPDHKQIHTSINYANLVSSVISEFEKTPENKGFIIPEISSKKDLFLTIDKQEIEVLLSVLIHNALRFSPNKTTVKIEVIERGDFIETIITDQGIGISEENLETIFKEFFVVNTYDVKEEKCMGLGLAIAKIIIQYHNGKIDVSSTLNSGTVVKFELPKK